MQQELRVGLLVESTAAGVGKHVRDLATGLSAGPFEIHVLYSARRMDGAFAEWIKALGGSGRIRAVEIGMRRSPAVSDWQAIRRVRRYLGAEGPFDILHCHSTKAALVGRLACAGSETRAIVTPHAPITLNPATNWVIRSSVATAERFLSRLTRAYVAVSAEEKTHLEGLGIPSRKIHLIPNGTSLPVLSSLSERRRTWRERLNIPERAICIGFVGRFVKQKRVDRLLYSFRNVAGRLPDATELQLALVGAGPLECDLRRLAITLGISSRVVWAGERDGASVMPAFDLFALSSDYEGFPYVLLEAIAAGVPFASTDIGGARALVYPKPAGIVVPDADGLEEALHTLVTSETTRASLGLQARINSQRFALAAMIARTIHLYEEVSDNERSGAGRIPAQAGPMV